MSASSAIRPLILLCISSFILMMSHGLSGLLLPVKLAADSVPVQSIGMILSSYSVGYLLGAILAKKILQRIGLVRTFSMCGSLAATGILCMGLDYSLYLWIGMRVLMGFSIACAMATLDTWYNSVSTQANRGTVLAVNQVVILTAITAGQFGLTLAEPSQATLFIISGLLFSLSITPLLFISQFEPKIESGKSMSVFTLFKISPLGGLACLICGILYSTIMNMLPLYATDVGITGFQLSLFMGAATAGGILLQIPVGYLSDRFERRKVIFASCAVLLISTFALLQVMQLSLFSASLVVVAVVMGIIACLYPLSISVTFDRALSEQLVPALSSLLCVYAIGSIIGPYVSSLVMNQFGNSSLFIFMCAVEAVLLVFILYRMIVREGRPVEEQESFVMYSPVGASEELDPRVEYHEQSVYFEESKDELVTLIQEDEHEAVAYLRGVSQEHPEWIVPFVQRVPELGELDLIVLYRTLALSAPDHLTDFVTAVTESEYHDAQPLVDWLIEKEPENTITQLAAISTASIEDEEVSVVETLAEANPELIPELTQEIAENVIESTENMRAPDREMLEIDDAVAEFISEVEANAPEHTQEVTEIFEATLEDLPEYDGAEPLEASEKDQAAQDIEEQLMPQDGEHDSENKPEKPN